MKTEPETFSLDDLVASPGQTTMWEGVRNYTIRNWMRDDMAVGDDVLFYHSSCAVPGVVGVAEITSSAYPDPTQFDPTSHYFDPKSKPEDPRWLVVDVRFVRRLARTITLTELKARARRARRLRPGETGQPPVGDAGHRCPVGEGARLRGRRAVELSA